MERDYYPNAADVSKVGGASVSSQTGNTVRTAAVSIAISSSISSRSLSLIQAKPSSSTDPQNFQWVSQHGRNVSHCTKIRMSKLHEQLSTAFHKDKEGILK